METPFNASKCRQIMESGQVVLLIANSRHSIRYLTGGYYYHFHTYSDRMGNSRYMPLLGLPTHRLEDSFYIGRKEERETFRSQNIWVPQFVESVRGIKPSVDALAGMVKNLGLEKSTIAIEFPFFPADGFQLLSAQLPKVRFVDATPLLNALREIKSMEEQRILRTVYSKVADCILRTFHKCQEGMSTWDIEQILRKEMAQEEVSFLFALICAGPGFSRAPSPHIQWKKGEVLHIDAGGEIGDYIADICRMGSLGSPAPEAAALHASCIEVQNRVRSIIKPGIPCSALVLEGKQWLSNHKHSAFSRFVVHGIGMVPYEQPECEPGSNRVLEAGMVLSIETDFLYPGIGHIKIEDAVLVTESGHEGLGDLGREIQIIP